MAQVCAFCDGDPTAGPLACRVPAEGHHTYGVSLAVEPKRNKDKAHPDPPVRDVVGRDEVAAKQHQQQRAQSREALLRVKVRTKNA